MDTAGVATDCGGAPAPGRRGGRGAQCTGPAAHDTPTTCVRGGRAERAFGRRAPDRARSAAGTECRTARRVPAGCGSRRLERARAACLARVAGGRSEEHTSELQSPCNLVCRLLLEKKKKTTEHVDDLHCAMCVLSVANDVCEPRS